MEFPFDSEFSIRPNQPSKAGFLSSKKGIVSWEIKKVCTISLFFLSPQKHWGGVANFFRLFIHIKKPT